MEVLLARPVSDQELWIAKTEEYLPKARRRIERRPEISGRSLNITDEHLNNVVGYLALPSNLVGGGRRA